MYKKKINNLAIILATTVLTIGCTRNDTPTHEDQYLKGDLGGMPVDLPLNIVDLVEYNGDPSWGETYQGEVPERTYQSKISSMGFDIRYTDGMLLDHWNSELVTIKDKEDRLPESPWLLVGFESGNIYHGKGATHRIGDGTINPTYEVSDYKRYIKQPELEHGLEVYAQTNIDTKTQKPYRQNIYAKDIFIERDADGEIITYIECSNRNLEIYATFPVTKPPCKQFFEFPNIDSYVYAVFSRHTLADWKKMQERIISVTLSFKANNTEQQ